MTHFPYFLHHSGAVLLILLFEKYILFGSNDMIFGWLLFAFFPCSQCQSLVNPVALIEYTILN